MSGSRSTGSRKNEMSPRKMMAMNNIATATGRRIDRLASDISGSHGSAVGPFHRDQGVDHREAGVNGRALLAGRIIDETLQVRERDRAEAELLLPELDTLARELGRALRELERSVCVAQVHEGGAHVPLDAQPLLPQRLPCVLRRRIRLCDLPR